MLNADGSLLLGRQRWYLSRSDPSPPPRRNCRIFADDGHDRSRPLCASENLPQVDRGLDVVIVYGYTCACFKDHNPRRSLSPSRCLIRDERSEEHTSELQSLMRISYAVFCLKKKHIKLISHTRTNRYT